MIETLLRRYAEPVTRARLADLERQVFALSDVRECAQSAESATRRAQRHRRDLAGYLARALDVLDEVLREYRADPAMPSMWRTEACRGATFGRWVTAARELRALAGEPESTSLAKRVGHVRALDPSMAAAVLAEHASRAVGTPWRTVEMSPLCGRIVSSLAEQGYELHGEVFDEIAALERSTGRSS